MASVGGRRGPLVLVVTVYSSSSDKGKKLVMTWTQVCWPGGHSGHVIQHALDQKL